MGIRVFCPNGHKLNVKSYLAGKRGVCPHCGAKFDIPAGKADASDRSDEKVQSVGTVSAGNAPAGSGGTATAQSTASAELRAAHLAKGASGVQRGIPTAAPAGLAPATPVVPSIPLGQGVVVPRVVPSVAVSVQAVSAHPIAAQPIAAQPMVGVAPAVHLADPLAEAPEANWYVRPPAGGQYGPAKSNVMRQWVAEGRVTADSLVWREGWPDWKLASATFPSLGGAEGVRPAPSPPSGQPGVVVTAVTSPAADDPFAALAPATPSSRRMPARRKDGTGRFVAIAALCVALVMLSALLVYVLSLQ